MRGNTAKRMIAVLLCVLMGAAFLSGCQVAEVDTVPGLPADTATAPEKPAEYADQAAVFSTELYFQSEDGTKLMPQQREIVYSYAQGRVRAVLLALSEGPGEDSGLRAVIPKTLRVANIQVSGRVCVVNFEGEMPENASRALLIMRAAIAATVHAVNPEVGYINVMINGVQPGYNGRPIGLLAPLETTLETYITDMEMPPPNLTGSDDLPGQYETCTAALYFASMGRDRLVCDTYKFYISRTVDPMANLNALIEEWMKGPSDDAEYEPVIPPDMALETARIVPAALLDQYMESPTGEPDAIDVSDETTPEEESERSIVQLWFNAPNAQSDILVNAALTFTIMSDMPNVCGVQVFVNGKLQTEGNAEARGYYICPDFRSLVGQNIPLYCPMPNGEGLKQVMYCVLADRAEVPSVRLKALLDNRSDFETGIAGFSKDDVLDVYVVDGTAVVNWKAGFLEKLRAYIRENGSEGSFRESLMVYSVVNTLTKMPQINRVWMLEDGREIRESAGNIYLGGALTANPGLLVQ